MHFVAAMDKQYCPIKDYVPIPGKPCLRWIAVGGSYPGALAGWIGQLLNSWFVATIASSGVVNAVYNATSFD